jgi:hypothetical protein
VRIGNREIPTFPVEFNWLYLCVHGSHHGWYRLFWLWDFAVIINGLSPAQASLFVEQAIKFKLELALGQAVALAKVVFSVEPAAPFEQVATPKTITSLACRFMFVQNMAGLQNSPFRVYYKLKTFSTVFFFVYYFRRIATFILRRYKTS